MYNREELTTKRYKIRKQNTARTKNTRRKNSPIAEALRISRAKYSAIFDSFPLGISITDELGNIIETNREAERLLGVSKDSHRGRHIAGKEWKIIRPDGTVMPQEEYASVRALKTHRRIDNAVMGILKEHNHVVWISVTAAPLRIPGYGVVITYGDITSQKITEDKLDETKKILDMLMEYVPEGITIADAPDGKIRIVSRYGQEVLGDRHAGLTTAQVIRKWKTYFPDGKTPMPAVETPLMRALGKGEIVKDMDVMQIDSMGKRKLLSCNAVPIYDHLHKKITGAIVAWRDITTLKEAELKVMQSERRYRSLFEQMTEGFALHEIITDARGIPCDYRFLEVNPAFEKLTGLKRKGIVGKLKTEVLPDDDPKWIEVYGKVALSGESVHFDNYSPALKRHYDVYSFSPAPGQFAVLFTDVTKRIEMERRKDDFINVASHELKTPLTSIKAYSQIIQQFLKRKDYRKIDMLFGRMNNQINVLQEYISDLLDVNKIQAGKMVLKKHPFDIGVLISETIQDLQETLANHTLEVDTIRQVVTADRVRIGQVLNNLITNAVRYSDKDTKIIVTCRKIKQNIVVRIQDFGIGIPEDQQEKIFSRFYQVEGLDRSNYGGLGLGLFISRDIIGRHGGKIWVESKPGKGSTFCFSLPADN